MVYPQLPAVWLTKINDVITSDPCCGFRPEVNQWSSIDFEISLVPFYYYELCVNDLKSGIMQPGQSIQHIN